MSEAETVVPEWKPERQILTSSGVDDKGFYKYEGTIEIRIDRFAEFVRGNMRRSAPLYIRGLPWHIEAYSTNLYQSKYHHGQDGQWSSKKLEVYIFCNKESTNQTWECQAIHTLRVVAQKEGAKDIIQKSYKDNFTGKENGKNINLGRSNYKSCEFLLDPDNGFIKDDIVILQVLAQPLRIKIISGIHSTDNGELFSSSSKYQSDFVLIIQDKEVHVQKSFLAMHSDYFKDQFTKHESDNRAIFQDVHYDDFIELLSVIYPIAYPITGANVETITELAFKFYMGDLLRRCEKKIIDQIENVADVKAMKPEYDALSDRTKRMMFDKIYLPGPVPNPVLYLESMSITTDRATKCLQELISSARCPPSGYLIVENNRIPVHKEHLALYSDYFTTMFQGEFAERNKDEIVLEEVSYNEILELLVVIYPTEQQLCVTETNVGVILKLADRFIMPAILVRCKNFLQNSTDIRAARKLWIAQHYNLPDLQVEYAQNYKTMTDVEQLWAEPEFKLFDDKTRALILDSIIS